MKKSKKIFFSTENVSWGGSELLWSRTILELLQFNVSITICIHKKMKLPQELLFHENDNKLEIIRYSQDTLPFFKRFLNRVLPYKSRFKNRNPKEDLLLSKKPDLLVINQGFNFNGINTMCFASKNKIPYVTISHAVNEALWPDLNLRKKMQVGFKNSVKNYFVSQDNLACTQNQLGFFLENAEVVRNPFNVSFDIDLDFPETENFHLACVGRYDFYAKGQDVLLQAISCEKWKDRNLDINFYGEGNDAENLKDLVEMYQLKNVKINSHTKTEDIWKTNQGLILTSRFEGLPIVIVEAMLCKRFVIVTNVSGNKEFILDNETGFIAAAPRAEYVDEALERAWQLRKNWKNLGQKAREEIVKQIPENPAFKFAHKLKTIIENTNVH